MASANLRRSSRCCVICSAVGNLRLLQRDPLIQIESEPHKLRAAFGALPMSKITEVLSAFVETNS